MPAVLCYSLPMVEERGHTGADCEKIASPEAVSVCVGEVSSAPSDLHYMYVLRCADGTLYTGYTTDVAHRADVHNAGKGAKYTRARRPVELAAAAEFPTKHQAMSAEYRFKRLSREEKLAFLDAAADIPGETEMARAAGFAALLAARFPQLAAGQARDEV